MPVQSERKYLGDWLKWEPENHYSREIVTVLAGGGAERALLTGMVLGRVTKGVATGAAVAGNTGNGTHHLESRRGPGGQAGGLPDRVHRTRCRRRQVRGRRS